MKLRLFVYIAFLSTANLSYATETVKQKLNRIDNAIKTINHRIFLTNMNFYDKKIPTINNRIKKVQEKIKLLDGTIKHLLKGPADPFDMPWGCTGVRREKESVECSGLPWYFCGNMQDIITIGPFKPIGDVDDYPQNKEIGRRLLNQFFAYTHVQPFDLPKCTNYFKAEEPLTRLMHLNNISNEELGQICIRAIRPEEKLYPFMHAAFGSLEHLDRFPELKLTEELQLMLKIKTEIEKPGYVVVDECLYILIPFCTVLYKRLQESSSDPLKDLERITSSLVRALRAMHLENIHLCINANDFIKPNHDIRLYDEKVIRPYTQNISKAATQKLDDIELPPIMPIDIDSVIPLIIIKCKPYVHVEFQKQPLLRFNKK